MPRACLAMVLVALGLAPIASCSGDSGEEPPGPIPVDALAEEFEVADCEFKVRCTHMPDAQTCRAVDGADYELLQLIAGAPSGKVGYDPLKARDWVEALRSQPCQPTLAVANALKQAWQPVFVGTIASAGPCLVDDECAGDAVCDRTACQGGPDCCAGACAARPAPVQVDGDCTIDPCAESLFCDPEGAGSGSPTCQPRADNGQACVDTYGCQDGQLCGNGKCYKLSPDGAQCNPNLTVACIDYSNWCDPAQSKCVRLPAAGQPCGATAAGCQLYAYCGGAECQSRLLEGQGCADGGPPCLGDLRCDNDVCTRRTIEVCVGDGEPPPMGGGGGGM